MTKPFSDMRPARFLALVVLLIAALAGGVLVARIHVLLLLIYTPIAFIVWFFADPAVIQRVFPLKRTREEVDQYLQSFLDGTATRYDWESFVILRIQDPQLDAIRCRLLFEAGRDPAKRARIAQECLEQLRRGAA